MEKQARPERRETMSVPLTKQIKLLGPGSWTVTVEEEQVLATCPLSFIANLLHVAKATEKVLHASFPDPRVSAIEIETRAKNLAWAVMALDEAHPGWREWEP